MNSLLSRHFYITFSILLFTFYNAQLLFAQIIDKDILEKLKTADRSEFRHIPKKPWHYSKQDWQAVIDSTWGQGMTTAKKLQLYDYFWNAVDQEYPGFFHIQDNWNLTLYNQYYSEISSGVSRGRFNAIMNHLAANVCDLHTGIADMPVSMDDLNPGVPLFVTIGTNSMYQKIYTGANYHHFGASLAPLPDSTAFVYDVVANHPLGLVPGDIILGYDNIPWKQLYTDLLAAELPLVGVASIGTNPESVIHGFLTSVGENWHLFNTIDIQKYSTGNVISLPTSLLANAQMPLLTSDQLPVAGVPFPDLNNGHFVSWGIVQGTQIGYIYTWSWTISDDFNYPTFNAGDEFLQALQILVNDFQIEGLIIDSRFNIGGHGRQYTKCLNFLFNEDQDSFLQFKRDDPNNHYSMIREYNDHFKITADNYLFDRPIAMLTGPSSVSCGDLMPLQMTLHPMVRTFGKGTNGVYGRVLQRNISHISPFWSCATSRSNFTLESDPGQFLTHLYMTPDEEIWFTRDDAVNGEDTVVKRALQWIHQMIYAHDVTLEKSYMPPNTDSLHVLAHLINPNDHNVEIKTIINILDSTVIDSFTMFDDGLHRDSLAGDGWYGNYIQPLTTEDMYTVSIKTIDLDSSHTHLLSNAKHFTTIGPVELFEYKIPPVTPNGFSIKLFLTNTGLQKTANNITAKISISDTNVTNSTVSNNSSFGSIAPGEIKTALNYSIFTNIHPDSLGQLPITIDIFSNEKHYWTDDTTINVVLASINSNVLLPTKYCLKQNYPNPFNPTTTIEFQIPNSQFVTLKIYNILGQEISTLVSEKLTAGSYKFNWDASHLGSGIFYCLLEAGNVFKQTKKIILMK